ncbi:hypothetical protein D3C72_2521470 [compost metagenome]
MHGQPLLDLWGLEAVGRLDLDLLAAAAVIVEAAQARLPSPDGRGLEPSPMQADDVAFEVSLGRLHQRLADEGFGMA